MKWLYNVLSWGFTCLVVALLTLLVGSFVFNVKVFAYSAYSSSSAPPGYVRCAPCNASVFDSKGTCGYPPCGGCVLGGVCPPFVYYL